MHAPTTILSTMTTRADSRALRQAEHALAVITATLLTTAAAQVSIPLPFTPVPFTFQPMVVLVAGAVLGSRLGALSQVIYLGIGIAGLPVFAASPLLPQGAARLFGPTGGYLMAYPAAAFLAGWLAERTFDRRYLTSLLAMTAGLALVFAGGVAWLAWFVAPVRGLQWAVATGLAPFIAADLLKVAVAAGITPSIWRLMTSAAR